MIKRKPDLSKAIRKLFHNNRAMFLAYDQGLEHGPFQDFNNLNSNPEYIIDIAIKGKYNGLILHKGIAEKYYENYHNKIPLILKLNGKTKLSKEYISRQITSVKKAVDLNASAVGYTIYVGSEHESKMFKEFGKIQEEAHDYGIPVILWSYPRFKGIKKDTTPELISYALRVGMELGADIVKVKYTGDKKTFQKAIHFSKSVKVLAAGGSKRNEEEFLKNAVDILSAGANGFAVGRNIWQSQNPLELSLRLRHILYKTKI